MIKIVEHKFEEVFPSISAYTTTYNCISGGYPYKEAIRSFAWTDELIVLDGGSDDGTRAELDKLKEEIGDKMQIVDMSIDWDDPGKDGAQKAMARAMCSSEFCLQFDADEICCGDITSWRRLAKRFPKDQIMAALPVYEPLGDKHSIRLGKSFNIWKWRLSVNSPEISHSIPDYDRMEVDGKIYSKGGSDGCFPVNIVNNKMVQSFFPGDWFSNDLYRFRDENINEYKNRLEKIFASTPFVYHVGHVDLENKIELYLKSWHQWWCHLYNKDANDPKNNLYFPGVLPKDVSKEMIGQKIKEMIESEGSIRIDSAVEKIDGKL